jgi:hypothetical protein
MDQQQSAKIAYNLGVHAASLRREVDSNPFPKTWKGSDNPLHRIWELGYAEGMLGVLPKQRPFPSMKRRNIIAWDEWLKEPGRRGSILGRLLERFFPRFYERMTLS